MSNPQDLQEFERLIPRSHLRLLIPASDMTLWRWLRDKRFPQPIYIGTRRYWKQSAIDKWIDGLNSQ